MKDAKKFETKMAMPSAKTHSVLLPFGFVLRTRRRAIFSGGLVPAGIAIPIAAGTLAPAKPFAK
jgi:hypothetical protein